MLGVLGVLGDGHNTLMFLPFWARSLLKIGDTHFTPNLSSFLTSANYYFRPLKMRPFFEGGGTGGTRGTRGTGGTRGIGVIGGTGGTRDTGGTREVRSQRSG